MGINGLWKVCTFRISLPMYQFMCAFKILLPAEEITTLNDLAVIDGYQRNSRGNHTLIIGVDTE